MRLGENQHIKVGGPIDPPSISLPAHSFNGLVDKRGRLDFGAVALALARAAQFIHGLPGEPLQVPNELFAGRNLFRIIQRKLEVPAAVRTQDIYSLCHGY
jgi:ribosomal protein S28E/S33